MSKLIMRAYCSGLGTVPDCAVMEVNQENLDWLLEKYQLVQNVITEPFKGSLYSLNFHSDHLIWVKRSDLPDHVQDELEHKSVTVTDDKCDLVVGRWSAIEMVHIKEYGVIWNLHMDNIPAPAETPIVNWDTLRELKDTLTKGD